MFSPPLEFYAGSGLFNFATSFGLGYFILFSKPPTQLKRVFSVLAFLVAQWSLFYFFWLTAATERAAVFHLQTCMIGVIFMPAVFTHFGLVFLQRKASLWLLILNYAISLILALNVYSPLFGANPAPHLVFPYWLEAGVLLHVHIAHFTANILLTHFLLFQALKVAAEHQHKQILYLVVGSAVGHIAGITNYLSWYRLPIPPVLNPLVSVYVAMIAYAIVRHQLLDIEIVIKKTLVFAGLVGLVVAVVSMVAFISQDVLAIYVEIPRSWSNVIAATIIAALYGRLRNWLTDITDRYLFQKKFDYKELLKRFTDELMVIVDLNDLVTKTVDTLVGTIKLESTSLLLHDKESRDYRVEAATGSNGSPLLLEDEPLISFIRKTHEAVGLDEALMVAEFPDAIKERMKQLDARLCLPLHLHDELIGVLCLGKKKSDEEFTKDDLDILLPLARTLAIAVSNAQLFDELSKTQAEAAQREKLAVIGTLSAGINHEICNPLGIIKAQSEAFLLDVEDGLLEGKSPAELLERVNTILRSSLKQIDRATAITQKLSSFAKPIKAPTAEYVSVDEEVSEVLALVGHDLSLEKVGVELRLWPGLAQILVDRRQFQEILFNLFRNAAQAITPPGTITIITAQPDPRHVRIEIRDTGAGMSAETLKKIYDPFFTTKDPGKGTGLGLFIVRQLVERNKGRIAVDSTVGMGTSFSLEFPAAPLRGADDRPAVTQAGR